MGESASETDAKRTSGVVAHQKDLVVPAKLKALKAKLREYQIKQGTGGDTGHLKKIISAREAYVYAGLVTSEAVDEYIREHNLPEPKPAVEAQQKTLWDL